MVDTPALSVTALLKERDERRRREKEANEQLQRRRKEEAAAFKRRLDEFQLTDDIVHVFLGRIRKAFDRGDTELMLTSFPSSFCTDDGRAVNNSGQPSINRTEATGDAPPWLATLPAGARQVYDYWNRHLRPGGFRFSARIINFPDGKPGDVGLFFSWSKDMAQN